MLQLRKLALALFPIFLGASLAACGGDSHAAFMEDTVDLMAEAADVLEGVTDVDSARAASKRLEKLGKQMQANRERLDALGEADPEAADKAMEKYLDRSEEIGQRMMETMMRLADKPEVLEALGQSMSAFR